MHKYHFSQIGEFHTNHNEDALAITDLGDNSFLIAVMDGCSMGKESHFASTLLAKLLRKIGKEISFRAFAERTERHIRDNLQEIMNRLFRDLGQLKNQLLLEREELLSTLILGVIDKSSQTAELITIGDGLICCNGALTEYEQDDQPDYLGYHLGEDFDDWYENQTQKLSLTDVKDLSISTDGIFTFRNFDGKAFDEITDEQLVDYLLIDEQWSNQELMLKKKVSQIEGSYGLKPGDDLTVVRIKFE